MSMAPAMVNIGSWGRYPHLPPRQVVSARFRDLDVAGLPAPLLCYGNGRSYGDSCLNQGGCLIKTRGLDRFIDFDPGNGRLRCEAGVLLAEILDLVVASGWFLPVTPGTRFVTIAGAIANDVHGKNHHVNGTFGHHVLGLELLRSDGTRHACSPEQNPALFAATIGGLGLTGVIVSAELQLRRIGNPYILVETTRFRDLAEFFDISRNSDRQHEFTVAWIDCAATGKRLGRGLHMAGNHAGRGCLDRPPAPANWLRVPAVPPVSLIGTASLRVFNALYYRKQMARRNVAISHYEPFFYPLDGIRDWNRIYGPRGFLQYQSVVPMQAGLEATREMLSRIAASGQGSFLSVLKLFGDKAPAGMLSFPCPGVTLALDFPNLGPRTFALLDELDRVVAEAGGRLYPAKDARMPGALFEAGYPRLDEFKQHMDPAFSSSFWRRVTGAAP
jgi:FAD/FMN-containing dehydrogenase